MFTETSLLSVPYSNPLVISPVSSMTRSYTSTIPLNNGILPTQQHNHRQMKIGNYFLERTIGKGNFAVVKLATHCDTHQKVAIKIIDKSRLEANDRQKLEREIAVMKSLVHPYIIRLYEVMESKNLIYLVTEYAANGELLDLLLREKRLSEPKAKEKFRQLILAVEYIHSKNIVHRDLKAENLLLDDNGNIKVADFGFANIFKPKSKLQTFCGSPPYAAPELFQSIPYSPEKVDVWSLGVLLYIFVCGHLPFDSNNLIELRKRVLSGQYRLPFYISSDCSSLISHMLTVNPEQRYTINDIKNHPWMMMSNQSNISNIISTPNCQLTNAILDHAELLGYNRTQILKSVHGNSFDSDAAIWHLLLEKFQKTCQIDNPHIPVNETNTLDLLPVIYDDRQQTESVYSTPNTELDSSERQHVTEPEIHIDYPDSSDDDDDDDEDTSEQLREQYTRTHGLRRHTVGRPDLLTHDGPTPKLKSKVPLAYPSTYIEPLLLTNRLTNLQERQQCNTLTTPDECDTQSPPSLYHQRNPHSTSYNGLSVHSPTTAPYQQQGDNHWLSPPVSNNFHMNRRSSDCGAHLRLFQQQHDVTGSNTIAPVRPTHIQSPFSNQSSRGSITRGAPITPPTFSITPHKVEEEDDDEDTEALARYLSSGKRHTVCEQGSSLIGKARRGTRESVKDRSPLSRRASDISSTFINNSARSNLEHLYNNAINLKTNDDEPVATSSVQELQKLQKEVQNYSANNTDSPVIRRASAVPSPTNSNGLHIIREEHQQNPFILSEIPNKSYSSSSSSSDGLPNIDDDDEMDCDVNIQHSQQQFIRPPFSFYRAPYHHQIPLLYYCNKSPLFTQHSPIPTTTASYTP